MAKEGFRIYKKGLRGMMYQLWRKIKQASPGFGQMTNTNEGRSSLVAGLLGIFLGGLGAHRFYLGYTTIGIVQIVVTICTCGLGLLWGAIEGVLILGGTIKTDAKGEPLKHSGKHLLYWVVAILAIACASGMFYIFYYLYPMHQKGAWFRYASEFDQARTELAENDAAKKGTAKQDFARLKRIKERFLAAKQPTEDEIISVLRSPDKRFQSIGLVAMSLKPIETDRTTDILFGFLQDPNCDFRLDALNSLNDFTKFPESKKAVLGKQLLEITKKEEHKGLSIREFSLLSKFPSQEAAIFLTEQLMREGKENQMLRYFAFEALKKMGNSFYDEAAEYVKNHGSPEVKEELFEREKYWKPEKKG